MNLPNKITLIRIILILPFVFFMYAANFFGEFVCGGVATRITLEGLIGVGNSGIQHSFSAGELARLGDFSKWAALSIFVIASITDALDGYIARKHNLVSNFGKFMDPLADKLLVCSALICLTAFGRLSAIVTLLIISREFIVSGLRQVAADKGIVIAASYWGKVKTTLQMFMIILLIASLPFKWVSYAEGVLIIGALILTVISMIDYMVKNRNVLKG